MGKRKVSILEPAATAVAEVAWFIESKGLPKTAKKFVIDACIPMTKYILARSILLQVDV